MNGAGLRSDQGEIEAAVTYVRDSSRGTLVRRRSAVLPSTGAGWPTTTVSTPFRRLRAADVRAFVGGIRAWMVLLPVDAVLLLAPLIWRPVQVPASVVFAVLGLFFITGGERFRARLHLAVLDDIPTLVGRLLMAVSISLRCCCDWPRMAEDCERSKASVGPSGSCSSSVAVSRRADVKSAISSFRVSISIPVRSRSDSS